MPWATWVDGAVPETIEGVSPRDCARQYLIAHHLPESTRVYVSFVTMTLTDGQQLGNPNAAAVDA